MIVAAGLTPAWQQILVFDSLRLGQVNRAREAHQLASGKVLNVGIAIHHLGADSLTLAMIGGLAGRSIDEEFCRSGVPHRWIWSERPTRVCTTVLDSANRVATEFVENAAQISPGELEAFVSAYTEVAGRARYVVLSGSLPAGVPKVFYRDLIERTAGRVILDASGQELSEALPHRPLCVKPNRDELARTVGRQLESEQDLKQAMIEVHHRGAEAVLVSHGADALWALCDGRFHVFQPPRITAVNPIGSGDCLAAGVAAALSDGSDMVEAIRFGMAAAAENAAMLLPSRLNPARVRARMDQVMFTAIP